MDTDKVIKKFTFWKPLNQFYSWSEVDNALDQTEKRSKNLVIEFNGKLYLFNVYSQNMVFTQRDLIYIIGQYEMNKAFEVKACFSAGYANTNATSFSQKQNFYTGVIEYFATYFQINKTEAKKLKFVWADELMNILYETLV